MPTPYLGEVKIIPFNFAPKGWAFCNGQLLAIAQNQALFAILGTTYGGNGTTNFALPNLQSRTPFHWGQGPGLTPVVLGEQGGTETVTLGQTQMPAHPHPLNASTTAGNNVSPSTNVLASGANIYSPTTPATTLLPTAVGPAGGGQAHPNIQPYLCVNFVIALVGVFPSRN